MPASKRKTGVLDLIRSLIFDPKYCSYVSYALMLIETALNIGIIDKVPYTEIDWKAYMQEAEGFLSGTRNYTEIRGDTGPCVYPAGFLYLFSLLRTLTDGGIRIKIAQYIYAFAYLMVLALVFRLLTRSGKVPPYVLVLMSLTSYRVHSIFVLRLFNDPLAMLLVYAAINLFVSQRWTAGSLVFSLAVSIKMNILLFAPALFFTYLAVLGFKRTVFQIAVCGLVQLILGLPFLSTYPLEYIKASFDLGRVFLHKWTVNYRFLPEEIFVSKELHLALLGLHILVLICFTPYWWRMLKAYGILKKTRNKKGSEIQDQLLLLPLFTSNFIGLVFARSLHYQFYVWYYHQLQYLCWSTRFSVKIKLLILGVIEMCWNVYPSTDISSGTLHVVHFVLLLGIFDYSRRVTQSASKGNIRILKAE